MANNRWQIGIAGNYSCEDDETVRQAILAEQQQSGCSTSEAAKHLILRAKSHLRSDVSTRETANAPADFSVVIAALNDGFSRVVEKLDNISVTKVPQPDRPELPTTMIDKPVEWETIDPEVPTPFLRGIKKVARPGMRLHDRRCE